LKKSFVKIFHDVYEKFEQSLLNEVAKENREQGEEAV